MLHFEAPSSVRKGGGGIKRVLLLLVSHRNRGTGAKDALGDDRSHRPERRFLALVLVWSGLGSPVSRARLQGERALAPLAPVLLLPACEFPTPGRQHGLPGRAGTGAGGPHGEG